MEVTGADDNDEDSADKRKCNSYCAQDDNNTSKKNNEASTEDSPVEVRSILYQQTTAPK